MRFARCRELLTRVRRRRPESERPRGGLERVACQDFRSKVIDPAGTPDLVIILQLAVGRYDDPSLESSDHRIESAPFGEARARGTPAIPTGHGSDGSLTFSLGFSIDVFRRFIHPLDARVGEVSSYCPNFRGKRLARLNENLLRDNVP